jgi:hypothetical protein
MKTEERLILDCSFERAVEAVLDACLAEGFTIAPVCAGNLHRQSSSGRPLRYALLDATLPELSFNAVGTTTFTTPTMFSCRVSLYELVGSCTLVTVERPVVRYPVIASLVPRAAERASHVMGRLMRLGILEAA